MILWLTVYGPDDRPAVTIQAPWFRWGVWWPE